ncbi:MAG: hypothetical protein ABIS69_08435 [Sediminibacterium sp.]
MKKILILLIFISAGLLAAAQNKVNNLVRADAVAKSPTKAVITAKEGTVVSYESNLVAGKLSLTRGYQQGEGTAFETIYTLVKHNDPTFNNRKPVRIGISRKSYDSVFTRGSAELAAKYPVLNKYITDSKISLDNEQGWIALINYYNAL